MVRHALRRPNLVLWLITIWRRGSQERERPLTLDGRTRGWPNWALGGVPRGPLPPAGRSAQAERTREAREARSPSDGRAVRCVDRWLGDYRDPPDGRPSFTFRPVL